MVRLAAAAAFLGSFAAAATIGDLLSLRESTKDLGVVELLEDVERIVAQPVTVGASSWRDGIMRPLIDRAVFWAKDLESRGLLGRSDYPYFNVIPMYQASAVPEGPEVAISADCFQEIRARARTRADGGIDVEVHAAQAKSAACSDNFLLLTTSGWKYYHLFAEGEHTIPWEVPADASDADRYDIAAKGIRVHRFMTDMATWAANLADTALLFEGEALNHITEAAARRNVDFLERYTHFSMPKAPEGAAFNVTKDGVRSGDFFGITRLDGLDPMLAWGMGSTTGHMAVAIWRTEESGARELYVVEATVKDAYWPEDGVQMHRWDEWIALCRRASFNMVHVPLDERHAAMFDEQRAWAFVEENLGLDYGYHTLLWGWIDTAQDNYPCLPPDFSSRCLHWELIETLFAIVDRKSPSTADQLWTEAMNKRLGTDGLRTAEAWRAADEQVVAGVGAKALFSVPEQDGWTYRTTRGGEPTTGRSMVCCVAVCSVWRAAGVLDGLDFNCGEQVNSDDHQLRIFEGEYRQVMGDYVLSLNGFNEEEPYDHMHESCESLPPDYERHEGC